MLPLLDADMKRDLELATKILLEIEKQPPAGGWHELNLGEYADETISYHIKLLYGVGLIDAIDLSSQDGFAWKAKDLTWAGHDFLDDAKKPKWLDTVREKAMDKGAEASFAAIVRALSELFKGVAAG